MVGEDQILENNSFWGPEPWNIVSQPILRTYGPKNIKTNTYTYVYVFVCVSMLLSDCNVWGRIHFGNLFLEKWTCELWFWGQNKHFSENGSPGQTTMLTRRASKFWVEPRSPFSEISHHDPKTIGKTPKLVPLPECQPELLGYVHFTFFHIIFILFSHFCEMCDFLCSIPDGCSNWWWSGAQSC